MKAPTKVFSCQREQMRSVVFIALSTLNGYLRKVTPICTAPFLLPHSQYATANTRAACVAVSAVLVLHGGVHLVHGVVVVL